MENINILDSQTNQTQSALIIDADSRNFLKETAKWARLIAIVGFVGLGLMVIFSFVAGTMFSQLDNMSNNPFPFPGAMFGVIYLIMAAIYFFPLLYLYRFASKMNSALDRDDQATLRTSLENLKSHYKYIGIFMIIMIGFYALFFVFGAIGSLFATF